jgi:hypothetical protein
MSARTPEIDCRLMRLPVLLTVALGTVAAWVVGAFQGQSRPIWFEGARLIVGDGTAPIENAAFVVEGDSFIWSANAASASRRRAPIASICPARQ